MGVQGLRHSIHRNVTSGLYDHEPSEVHVDKEGEGLDRFDQIVFGTRDESYHEPSKAKVMTYDVESPNTIGALKRKVNWNPKPLE
ncbi:hypothetical protein AAMO2058_000532400 [Amorphochlora amoebiformis]